MENISLRNVAKFVEAYKKRTEFMADLNTRIKSDFLLLTGMRSKYVADTEAIHKAMTPGLCSMIKVEDVSEPLVEAPEKVAEAMLLFCQVGPDAAACDDFSMETSRCRLSSRSPCCPRGWGCCPPCRGEPAARTAGAASRPMRDSGAQRFFRLS